MPKATPDQRRASNQKYRAKNVGKILNLAKARRHTIRDWLQQYKRSHPCISCGEADPIVLEFDHRDPKQKLFNIGLIKDIALSRVIAEVAKCDVRCANCHRRKTWLESKSRVSSVEAAAVL